MIIMNGITKHFWFSEHEITNCYIRWTLWAPNLSGYVVVSILSTNEGKRATSRPGVKPRTSWAVVRCFIHYTTGPLPRYVIYLVNHLEKARSLGLMLFNNVMVLWMGKNNAFTQQLISDSGRFSGLRKLKEKVMWLW